MSDALDLYTKWYRSKPWWWRFYNNLWWKTDSIWSALVGKPGPGERFILSIKVTKKEKD